MTSLISIFIMLNILLIELAVKIHIPKNIYISISNKHLGSAIEVLQI